MRNFKCGSCTYWTGKGNDEVAECHRYPPQFVAFGATGNGTWKWPTVEVTDSCGEHCDVDKIGVK